MKNHVIVDRFIVASIMLLVCLTAACLGPLTTPAYGKEKMYQEFEGVMLFYKPVGVDTYRQLLPTVFDMPDEPLVLAYIINFYKMASWTIKPYLETAVFLLAKYNGETIWHCITMPVTTDEARIGGITYFGYPKVLADITLDNKAYGYSGKLTANGRPIIQATLDTTGYVITPEEKEWFDRLTGIGSLNILNGRVIDPTPGTSSQRDSLLKLSQMYPATFSVKVGRAKLTLNPEAAPKDKGWRPSAFAIQPAEIVLAYYFKNKFGFSFGRPRDMSD